MPANPVPFQFTETQLAYLAGSLASDQAQGTRKGLDQKWTDICTLIVDSAGKREKALAAKGAVRLWDHVVGTLDGFKKGLSQKHPKLRVRSSTEQH